MDFKTYLSNVTIQYKKKSVNRFLNTNRKKNHKDIPRGCFYF